MCAWAREGRHRCNSRVCSSEGTSVPWLRHDLAWKEAAFIREDSPEPAERAKVSPGRLAEENISPLHDSSYGSEVMLSI